jgi:hypothetical protein
MMFLPFQDSSSQSLREYIWIILSDGPSPVKKNFCILFGSAVPWLVDRDRQFFLIMEEILVRGKNRHLIPHGDGTDQEINLGTLDPGFPTGVEEFSGPLVIRLGIQVIYFIDTEGESGLASTWNIHLLHQVPLMTASAPIAMRLWLHLSVGRFPAKAQSLK